MKKRYTVRYEPTGAGRVLVRIIGVFHAVVGTLFSLGAVSIIIQASWFIGLIFLAAGIFFAVNGVMIALGKNGLLGRAYRIETDIESEDENIFPSGSNVKQRLEQLESLRSAGLISDQEYRQKRQEILKDL